MVVLCNLLWDFFSFVRVGREVFRFDLRVECSIDGFNHVERLKELLVIVAGFEDGRGHRAGPHSRLATSGGWGGGSIIAIRQIV